MSGRPYYRISAYGPDLTHASTDPADADPPYYLSVDGIPHQQMWDSEMAATSDLHPQVYHWFPERTFDRVLIIGAGTGTDVALALAQGAKHVDAVEIDPRPRAGRPRLPSRGRLQGPARHRPRQRRPCVPQRLARPVRPDHVRGHGLAHARQLDRRRATGVLPLHRGIAGGRSRSPRAGRRVHDVQPVPRAVARREAGPDDPGRLRLRAARPADRHVVGDPRRRAGRGRPRWRPATWRLRRPGAERRPAGPEARDRRLALPVPANGDRRARTT